MHQPHVPRTPHQRFVGASGLGSRGDAIVEADWAIGEFVKTLEAEGLLNNTLIIISSDNGPVLNDGYKDMAVEKNGKHTPAGPFRGGKYSLFEAGTHVPFVTYWKGHIKPAVSSAMVCQIDLLSSIATLVGDKQKVGDSQDLMDVFLGKKKVGRGNLVIEATSRTAFRQGDWVMIPPYPGPAMASDVHIELGNSKEYQLYNIILDPGQLQNQAKNNPEKLNELLSTYNGIRGVQSK
jgi:arylsulfatase A-like enzyme